MTSTQPVARTKGDLLVTQTELAELTGWSQSTISRWAARGYLAEAGVPPIGAAGQRPYFRRVDVDRYIRSLETPTPDPTPTAARAA